MNMKSLNTSKLRKLEKLNQMFKTRYFEVIGLGGLLVVISGLLYRNYYAFSHDDILGLIVASFLFLGAVLIGQGIRGWRDAKQWSARFLTMRTRSGVDLRIKKRVKR